MSFSTVSNAQIFSDTPPQELPLSDSDVEDETLEIEVYETNPMLGASPYLLLVFLDQHTISAESPLLTDNYTNRIDIPPSQRLS